MVIVNFGQLNVVTEKPRPESEISVRKMHQKGAAEDEIFSTVLSESYTKFKCQLAGFQVSLKEW